ncbi:MAG: N-acetyl sugar amidotransferase [Longimicrobiales bacterium]|jgi:N-acetyl sugar amidotransferase|nr:N-acetyl sugar amidotransferase [Longimicrobiales bacterium]
MFELSLDKQFDELPKDVVYCKNCVVSNQRPRTRFNEEGICSACQWALKKDQVVDWDTRAKELADLCDRFRRSDGEFDCIVPGSGGKDSAYVAHQLKVRYGMHPLCVTWSPFEYTDIGWKNLEAFVNSGFTNILGQPDGLIHRKMTRLSFELKGDAWEPFAYGQKAWAFHIANKFDIKLIFYGENGELEYGGSEKYMNRPMETPEEWEYEYYKGSGVTDLIRVGLERGILSKEESVSPAMNLYRPPPPEEISERDLEMHWYSYYHRWTPQENFYYAVKNTGLQTNPEGHSEGTYTKHVSLDDKADGFHWYLAYMKFGMCRCSRDAQTDIRRHHITREEGVALVNRYDGEFPRRHFKWFLQYMDVKEEYFWAVMDFYREKSNVWEKENGSWVMKYPVI